jgi:uncharacterized protein with HEPN domain
MSEPREWRFYLTDMISFCERIQRYMQGIHHSAFEGDAIRFDATVRNLELLDEAARHIPDAVRALAPEVPWRMIIATRNRLIHGYLGIDNDTLWSIVSEDVPRLLHQLKAFEARL